MRGVRVERALLICACSTAAGGRSASFAGDDLSDTAIDGGFQQRLVLQCAVERCKLTGADLINAGTMGLDIEEVQFCCAKLPGISFR
jgi:hypothetical protein